MTKPSRMAMQSLLDRYHQCLWSMVMSEDLFGGPTSNDMAWMVQLSAELESLGFTAWSDLSTAISNEKG